MSTDAITIRDSRNVPVLVHPEIDESDLDVYAFRVYATICRNIARYGEHTESVASMAARIGMGESRARQALRTLEVVGLIVGQPEPGYATAYRLAWKPS